MFSVLWHICVFWLNVPSDNIKQVSFICTMASTKLQQNAVNWKLFAGFLSIALSFCAFRIRVIVAYRSTSSLRRGVRLPYLNIAMLILIYYQSYSISPYKDGSKLLLFIIDYLYPSEHQQFAIERWGQEAVTQQQSFMGKQARQRIGELEVKLIWPTKFYVFHSGRFSFVTWGKQMNHVITLYSSGIIKLRLPNNLLCKIMYSRYTHEVFRCSNSILLLLYRKRGEVMWLSYGMVKCNYPCLMFNINHQN